MRRTRTILSVLVLSLATVLLLGCQAARPGTGQPGAGTSSTDTTTGWHWDESKCPNCEQAEPVVSQPESKPKPARAAPPPAPAKQGCAEVFFPTGQRATSTVHMTKCAPPEVQVGVQFDYVINVTNISNMTLKNVVVTDQLGENYRLASANPSATGRDGRYLRWSLGDMTAGQSKQIKVTGVATSAGKLTNCVTVTYDLPVCLAINVTNPKLELTKTAPSEVLKCDPIPIRLVVTNTGQGPARDVKITDNLPEGLVTEDGRREVTVNVGTLAAGQSRETVINARAQRTGTFQNRASVSGAGGLSDQASSTTVVKMPVLEVDKTGPAKRYLGTNIAYDITVRNTGDGVAKDAVLVDPVPAGATWVRATEGGQVQGDRVVWQLGDMQPGASRTVQLTVSGARIGTVRNEATVRAYCAEPASDDAVTEVAGIPAILLEVIDIDDPVEVGNETVYEIVVTNQGSTAGTNIAVTVNLEDTMQFVDATGATAHQVSGDAITLAPVASLAPKAKATWRIRVKALSPGDVRLHVTMNSDQLGRDVSETEATNFYE